MRPMYTPCTPHRVYGSDGSAPPPGVPRSVSHTIWLSATAVVLPNAPQLRFQLRLLLRYDPAFAECIGASVGLLDHHSTPPLAPP